MDQIKTVIFTQTNAHNLQLFNFDRLDFTSQVLGIESTD